MGINSILASRAGDEFHYRWTARRCLKLLDHNASLGAVYIEGSQDNTLRGEDAIDTSEYYYTDSSLTRVDYFQLKHSLTESRLNSPASFSELKKTLGNFAKRYKDHIKQHDTISHKYYYLSNREVSKDVKKFILFLQDKYKYSSKKARENQINKWKKCTSLNLGQLRDFLQRFTIIEDEKNFESQKSLLRWEMNGYLDRSIDSCYHSLMGLIREKVTETQKEGRGFIDEDLILEALGHTRRDLFPAPPSFEKVQRLIPRESYKILISNLLEGNKKQIVTATGGVGKTVFAQHLVSHIPEGSVGVLFDCYAGGMYTRASDQRHLAKNALVQITNELHIKGVCKLYLRQTLEEDKIYRFFLERLGDSISRLRETIPDAKIYIIVDAADNAEMVASDRQEKSFVKGLAQEELPEGVRLIYFCRPERKQLLGGLTDFIEIELSGFTKEESGTHLAQYFEQVSDEQIAEFHSLTHGNPRVQATALANRFETPEELLKSFDSSLTLEKQFDRILDLSIEKVARDSPFSEFKEKVEAICIGMAVLPPLIPLKVLADPASVSENDIISFASDFGKNLSLTSENKYIQFRDEPTEDWFRNKYRSNANIERYVECLGRLADESVYASSAIPELLLKAEKLDELSALALSNDFLPNNQPSEAEEIRINRLKYAFKAELKRKNYVVATKISLRLGEALAVEERSKELLLTNLDLVSNFFEEYKILDFAHNAKFDGNWFGSSHLYSSSLLSLTHFKDEGIEFLSKTRRYLKIYFEKRDRFQDEEKDFPIAEKLTRSEIKEYCWACFHLLEGESKAHHLKWRPDDLRYEITKFICNRLIDIGDFEKLDEFISLCSEDIHSLLGCIEEAVKIGRFVSKEILEGALSQIHSLSQEDLNYRENRWGQDWAFHIIAFLESLAHRSFRSDALTLLERFCVVEPSLHMWTTHGNVEKMVFYVRCKALHLQLKGEAIPNASELCAKLKEDERYSHSSSSTSSEERGITALLPAYYERANLILNKGNYSGNFKAGLEESKRALDYHDRYNKGEIYKAWFQVLLLISNGASQEVENFIDYAYKRPETNFWPKDKVATLRCAYRNEFLKGLFEEAEHQCGSLVELFSDDSPEEKAHFLIKMARAVMSESPQDASVYFHQALKANFKLGDQEANYRWDAHLELGKNLNELPNDRKSVYRLLRSGEFVGNTVYKEKHWNRNALFEVALKLNAPVTLEYLSRSRDRKIGYFPDQLEAVLLTALDLEILSPEAILAMSGFRGCNGSMELLKQCLNSIDSPDSRSKIVEIAYRDFSLSGMNDNELDSFSELSACNILILEKVKKDISLTSLTINDRDSNSQIEGRSFSCEQEKVFQFDEFVKGRDLNSIDGLKQLFKDYSDLENNHYRFQHWAELLNLLKRNDRVEFLKRLLCVDQLYEDDFELLCKELKSHWLNFPTVSSYWNDFLKEIGKKLFCYLNSPRTFSNFVSYSHLDTEESERLVEGILQGYTESSSELAFRDYFKFTTFFSKKLLTTDQSKDCFDYSCDRFELNMEEGFSDGEWGDWLETENNASEALVGIIWSALASPLAEEKWGAIHTVYRLGQLEEIEGLRQLIELFQSSEDQAFYSKDLPFYRYNAQHYLLIALCRVCKDKPSILVEFKDFLASVALNSNHLLIKVRAAEIALSIHAQSPYSVETYEKLLNTGKSQQKQRARNRRRDFDLVDSPFHQEGNLAVPDVSLESDFDRYWCKRLTELFGIPAKQIEELVKIEIVEDLGISPEQLKGKDPRSNQRDDRLWYTYDYRKNEIPRNESFGFYCSFNAYHKVASRLLDSAGLLEITEDTSKWETFAYFLERYSITHQDGRWLSEYRDPSPIIRNPDFYTNSNLGKDWQWSVKADDFFSALQCHIQDNDEICIDGHWQDCTWSETENYRISCALVSPCSSSALARSVNSPRDLYLPKYEDDEDSVIECSPFILKGLISHCYRDGRLDRHDPYNRKASYTYASLGGNYRKLLNLKSDELEKVWTSSHTGEIVGYAEEWSEDDLDGREKNIRYGHRLILKTSELQKLCLLTELELILCVEISRNLNHSSDSGFDQYACPNSHKIFILNADGNFREK